MKKFRIPQTSYISLLSTLLVSLVFGYLVFLFQLPTFILQVGALGCILYILKQLVDLYRNQPIHGMIFLAIALCIAFSFTFYFKLDRDYAAYVSNAYYLIQNQSFFSEATYFDRGLEIWNGQYTPSFLWGYSVYLSLFISLFQDWGIILANIILLASFHLFSLEIYRIISRNNNVPNVVSIIILANPVIFWIFSQTYSEGLFISLIWGSILCFLLGIERKNIGTLTLSVCGIAVSFSTRVEAIGLFMTIGLATLIVTSLLKVDWKTKVAFGMISLAVFAIIVAMTSAVSGSYVSKQFGDASRTVDVTDKDNTWEDTRERLQLLMLSFGTYLVILPAVWAATQRKTFTNKKIIWIVWIILPFALYLYNPRITRDFPWLLRRYVNAIIPFIVIVGIWAFFETTKNSPRLRKIVLTTYITAQTVMVSFLMADTVDHRPYYQDLIQFFEQNVTSSKMLYVRGDIDMANEAGRVVPAIRGRTSEFSVTTSKLEEIVVSEGDYLVDTVVHDDPRLILIDEFSQPISTFQSNVDSTRYNARFREREDIILYLYKII